jgi:membrane protease YdiL (CAAX protease family)
MRPLRTLLIYLAFVFIGGALLAPWLYWAAQWAAPHAPWLKNLAASPFHRFEDRAFLLCALAGLWPLLRRLGGVSWHELGVVRPAAGWRKALAGFLLGLVSLALVIGLALVFGGRELNHGLSGAGLGRKLAGAAFTAVVVAVMEEILFRGGIFGGLRRVFDWKFALGLSSAAYALVHFLEGAELPGDVTWTSGLKLLPLMLRGFTEVHALVPGFFSLTLAGGLLALAYQRTGSLNYSIGLHAGWVFCIKISGVLTTAPAAGAWFWGTGKLFDGWLAFLVLMAMAPVFSRLLPKKK